MSHSSIDRGANLSEEDRRAIETLIVRLADDEFVIAERYTEWQVRAPSLESDLALSNIAQDELGHARLWYDALDDFGHEERDLLYERDSADFRHATITELPFETGDWADAIVRSYLYDVAEELRLDSLRESTYPPIANRVPKIAEEETYHRQHAESWLERLAESSDGRRRLQDAIDRLFPHALTLFEPAAPPALASNDATPDALEIERTIVERGFRPTTLQSVAQDWLDIVSATLAGHDLRLPLDGAEVTEADLPSVTGRSGTHTAAWEELYDEFTQTYRELGRTYTTRIMQEPADDG